MPNAIVQSKPMGRPLRIDDTIVQKLVDIFRLGVTDTVACAHAGISRTTFYERLKVDEDFADKITTAKNFAIIASRQNVVKSIVEDKNLDTSKWYLEKHDVQQPQAPQTQVNVFNMLKEKYTMKNGHTNGVVVEEKHG